MFFQFEPIGEENTFQEFCKDLFNLLYKTQSFQGYKTKGAVQYGVDIYSTEFNIVLQCKKKKLLRSEKSIERELIADFDNSIWLLNDFPFKFNKFILISTARKFGSVQDYAGKLAQECNFEIEYWSWEDIEPLIIQYTELREKYYPHLYQPVQIVPKIITYIPKIDENEIIGRDTDFKKLQTYLDESKKGLIINGIGGIGKSTLAKFFINKYLNNFDHIVWIDVENSSMNDDFDELILIESFTNNPILINNLDIKFTEDISLESKFQIILNKLNNINGNNIIVIDNAPSQIGNYENEMPGLPYWKVLLTSRIEIPNYKSLSLDVLDEEDAILLFFKYYTIEKNDILRTVLNYIGNHTLTIELLSKTANLRRITLNELASKLKAEGLNMSPTASIHVAHNINRKAVRPFEYLLSIFSIFKLSNEQKEILRYFSVLPTQFFEYNTLKQLFNIPENDNDFFEGLKDLVANGWIKEENGGYKTHQIIQEVLRFKLLPDEENCEPLIKSITNLLSFSDQESYISKVPYLTIAEHLLKYLYTKQVRFISLINNVAALNDYNGNSKKALYFYNEIIQFIENEDCNESEVYYIYVNIAVCYLRLGEYEKALKFNLKVVEYVENELDKDYLKLAMLYSNIGENYRFLGNIRKSLEYMLQAIKIFETYIPNMKCPELAIVYNNISNTYGILENRKMSLKYGLIATELRENILVDDHPYLAQSYNSLAVDYEKLGHFDKSEEYHIKALKIRAKIFTSDHYDLAESYTNLGTLHRAKGEFKKAIDFHLKSIQVRENIFPSDHPEVSKAYGIIAEVYLSMQDYANAQKYFTLTIEKLEKKRNAINPYIALFYCNYASLHLIQNNLLEAKNYINKSIDMFNVLFEKSHPDVKVAAQIKEIIESKISKAKNFGNPKTIGRNDPCYCHSGKKYKYCCGKNK
ncbi:tetratricopeptide repeat protein [uncultured Draconibacterium sp.]|uniref:tetratricopeptide repeat protein n=1 Tax=uncultured Draconibacterium sp. TaxID=1573823 RepID=UPI0029C93268|nr:tetratricopeptide repeat protein [uncultured Draconibacterium sp.]